jgi:hypothetical protein
VTPLFQARSYQRDRTRSRSLSEVKLVRARRVLRWVTTLEHRVLCLFTPVYTKLASCIISRRDMRPTFWSSARPRRLVQSPTAPPTAACCCSKRDEVPALEAAVVPYIRSSARQQGWRRQLADCYHRAHCATTLRSQAPPVAPLERLQPGQISWLKASSKSKLRQNRLAPPKPHYPIQNFVKRKLNHAIYSFVGTQLGP